MKLDKSSLQLYAVTDRSWTKEKPLKLQVEEAILAGVTFVQLREKNIDNESFLKLAKEIKGITDRYKVPFVINDNVEIAISVRADGVHVGQDDMSVEQVRLKIGADYILGVSVQTVEQALLAEAKGADYLGVGTMFPTSTKGDASLVAFQTLQQICNAVSIPVVAIGGINKNNILNLAGSGIDGIAVVSAIFAAPDIEEATHELYQLSTKIIGK